MTHSATAHHICVATAATELRKSFRRGDGDTLVERKASPPTSFLSFEEQPISSFAEMHALLSRLLDDPHKCIVLGSPLVRGGERSSKTFLDTVTNWWLIDIDTAPRLDADLVVAVRKLLPFLSNKAFIIGHTQSAGLKEGLRLRVVCRVDRKTLAELRTWAKELNGRGWLLHKALTLDASIYQEARLIFTSRPALDGIADPFPGRLILVPGDESPVEIDMPKLTQISMDGDLVNMDTLPKLPGKWDVEGDGHGRSEYALVGIGLLKTFMGDDWGGDGEEDKTRRKELWLQMLSEADASHDSFRRYSEFIDRRWRDARSRSASRAVPAIENIGEELPLEQAETRHRAILKDILSRADAGTYCIHAPLAIGKTRTVLELLASIIDYTPDGSVRPWSLNVDLYVPTIELAREVAERAAQFGIRAFVEFGRGQEVDGEPVCYKAEAVRHIQGVVRNVAELVCKSSDAQCEFYTRCRWQWQRNSTSHIHLRIRTHSYLPLPMRGHQSDAPRVPDIIVIDESSFFEKMLHTKAVKIGDLIKPGRLSSEQFDRVLAFAKVLDDGLTMERLIAAGFTPEEFEALAAAENALQPNLDVEPSMSPKATLKAVKGCSEAADWYRFAQVWRNLAAAMRAGSMNRVRRDGEYLILNWRGQLAAIPFDQETGRPTKPVIILSATMRRSVIEQFLPIDEFHFIEAKKHPGATLRIAELRGSKNEALYGSSDVRIEDGETDDDRIAAAREVRNQILEDVKASGATLVTYKELEGLFALPPERTAHFKALEGLNRLEGKDGIYYGRPLPAPPVVENMARALYCDSDQEIPSLQRPWYPKRAVQIRGQSAFAMMEYHPDPRVEDIRWMLCEGEVMQALGRSRYLRYPVKMTLYNRMALPISVDEIADTDAPRRRVERSAVIPITLAERLRLFGFGDERSAKRAYEPHELAQRHLMIEVEYRRKGARGPMTRAFTKNGLRSDLGFEVSAFAIPESDHNRWVSEQINLRELVEMLMRDPTLLHEELGAAGPGGRLLLRGDGEDRLHIRLLDNCGFDYAASQASDPDADEWQHATVSVWLCDGERKPLHR